MVTTHVFVVWLHDNATILWDIPTGQLLKHLVQLLLVGSCISVEIASLLIRFIHVVNLLCFRGNVLEAAKALHVRGVDVHVVDLWLLNHIFVRLLGYLFLEHLHLFLIFLDTHIQTVCENISVNDLGGSESSRGLFVSEASGSFLFWHFSSLRGSC